jgi:aminoacylase
MSTAEDISVTSFRKYLQINTMHPNPNYGPAITFLQKLAEEIGLSTKVVTIVPGNPVLIMTWLGKQPNLPSILLNSHMDVVPVFPENWTYDPFSAHKDEKGNIYARGAQDMKCVGIQYVEAVRRLKKANETFLRTIHILFVPDEEVNGSKGMKPFVHTQEFKDLNVGFALDEGIAVPESIYQVYYAERVKWWLRVTCSGNPGHGSKFIENTAAEKFQKVVNKFLSFREEQKKKLESDPKLSLGDVTTVNMTIISGGVQVNVVPAELRADFDIRIPPTVDLDDFQKTLESWCTEIGSGIKTEFIDIYKTRNMTSIDENDRWWKSFSGVMKEMNLEYQTKVFLGATDARYLRELGLPAIGFSPMINTPQLLHDHDEFLNEKVYLRGLEIYCRLIPALANSA